MHELLVIGAVLVVPLLWLVGTFNGLVRLRNHCRESWADIDAELKRRHDLVPNLVETARAYARHERELLERVVELRNRADAPHERVRDQGRDESELVRGIARLCALAEAYPDLKADEHFLQLQNELVNTEDRIQAARRFFNANVRDMNNRIEMFPSSIVAAMGNFPRWDFFEVETLDVRAVPRV